MGQKTNSNLLRLGIGNIEWKSKYISKTFEESSFISLKDLEIKSYLKQFLSNNGLILHDYNLHANETSIYLYISYFISFKSLFLITQNNINQKLILKKKKTKIYEKIARPLKIESELVKQKNFIVNSLRLKRNSLLKKSKADLNISKHISFKNLRKNNFTEQILETLNIHTNGNSNIYIVFQNLNSNLTIELKHKIWKKKLLLLRRYKRNKFFKETINILAVATEFRNSSQLIADYLAKQLSTLQRQSYFLTFLKRALNLFVNSKMSQIIGLKIIISGRFNKRPRARSSLIIIGNVPTQTLNTNIDHSQAPAFSSNGTFGIKVWIAEKF